MIRVRFANIGEYGGHFGAPGQPMTTQLGEYGGHFWAPVLG